MDIKLENIFIENFKSFENLTTIPISNLSVFLGANSSGKSTALQTLLALKQTLECNSPDIELLLSGKYITLGDYEDVINDAEKRYFQYGISIKDNKRKETSDENESIVVFWKFSKSVDGNVFLEELSCALSDDKIQFRRMREDGRIYNIYFNAQRIGLSVRITNLEMVKLLIHYNQEFNDVFYNFLKELQNCFISGKKVTGLEKEQVVFSQTVDDFYEKLIRYGTGKSKGNNGAKERKNKTLAKKIQALIKKFCQTQIIPAKSFRFFTDGMETYILESCVERLGNTKKLDEVIKKYEGRLEKYIKDIDSSIIPDTYVERDINDVYFFERGKSNKPLNYSMISEAYSVYTETIKYIFRKIFYLGPIREKPQGLYNIGFEMIPKYVGPTGAYFASVLLQENKIRNYVMPGGKVEKMCLLDALDEWTSHLNVASKIEVDKSNSFGFSVSISNTQQIRSDIMNTGIGTSQILPVLIMGLLSEEGEYLFYEQPELHLHPFSQSRLADFFIALIKNGRKVLVETHSEHFLLRLRYQVLTNNIDPQNISINFFQNKGGTQISQGTLHEYGSFQYPEDFRDETQQLLSDLLNASMMKSED